MDAEEADLSLAMVNHILLKSNANDTDLVTISDPEYAVINGPEDCDHPDNQYVNQKWTSSAFGNFSAYYEHLHRTGRNTISYFDA